MVARRVTPLRKEPEETDDYDPALCQRLYKAVVVQALHDACHPAPEPLGGPPPPGMEPGAWFRKLNNRESHRAEILRERERGRAFLTGDITIFRQICELAGWDPEYIQRGVRKVEKRGWKMPKNLKL